MNESETKCALVARMWSDDIVAGSQYADVESVARHAAIPRSDEGAAKDLLREMAADSDCPVVTMGSGMVALRRDRDAVADYLKGVCEDDSDVPWDLR